ncbi:MAG TPA: hypothetical protein PKX92_06035 [Edaphocola sp.]|nr:hypothetical protein [Edaphocola sp.]
MVKYILGVIVIALLVIFASCEKYKDTPGKDLGLTRKYCNDPRAANYNDSFPGVPDNDVCIYPNEIFEGNWQLKDSVFLQDGTFQSTAIYNLSFSKKDTLQDSLKRKIIVSGFCNAIQLHLTANKYGTAITDTLIPNTQGGQLFCQNTDTVFGQFKIIKDSLTTTMNINLTVQSSNQQYLHIGKAIKQ